MHRDCELRIARTVLVALTCLAPMPAGAQDVASRLPRDGRAAFTTVPRDGVCGDGRGTVWLGGNMSFGNWSTGMSRERDCRPGPLRVEVTTAGGAVQQLRFAVGPVPAASGEVRDLGELPTEAARAWLLDVVRTADGRSAEKAIMPLVLLPGQVPWRGLLAVARDEQRPRGVRRQSSHWLARLTSLKLAGHPDDLAWSDEREHDEAMEIRKAAVFALSQRRDSGDELLRIARTHREPAVRAQALFWLGERDDPRALGLFEEILGR